MSKCIFCLFIVNCLANPTEACTIEMVQQAAKDHMMISHKEKVRE